VFIRVNFLLDHKHLKRCLYDKSISYHYRASFFAHPSYRCIFDCATFKVNNQVDFLVDPLWNYRLSTQRFHYFSSSTVPIAPHEFKNSAWYPMYPTPAACLCRE